MIYAEDLETVLESPDLSLGRVELREKATAVPAVEAVAEVGHYETVKKYENGGKDVVWVVDTPGVVGREQSTITEQVEVYVPYTKAELQKMEYNAELDEILKWFSDNDYKVLKVVRGNWPETDERYVAYLAEYQIKYNRKVQLETALQALQEN